MQVVYTNSRGDKCLQEDPTVWCKQISQNKLEQSSWLKMATAGKVFPFTLAFPSHHIISLNHISNTDQPLTVQRQTGNSTTESKVQSFAHPNVASSPPFQFLACFVLPL